MTRGRAGRVQHLPDDAGLADDRVRLGDQPAAARHGVVEADAGGARRAAGDRPIAEATARLRRRARFAATIEFRHLTFAYGDHVVLHDVSAVLPAGTTTAIVGRDRLGQVDAAAPACRACTTRRRARCSSTASTCATFRCAVLRGAIGFVPQEPFLFSTTIAENIAFGAQRRRQAPPRAASSAAAAVARLDKDVAAFPKGYDTMVGERGITLSGGQKQRTAIARALIDRSADPRPGRRAVGGGHLHRRRDPRRGCAA